LCVGVNGVGGYKRRPFTPPQPCRPGRGVNYRLLTGPSSRWALGLVHGDVKEPALGRYSSTRVLIVVCLVHGVPRPATLPLRGYRSRFVRAPPPRRRGHGLFPVALRPILNLPQLLAQTPFRQRSRRLRNRAPRELSCGPGFFASETPRLQSPPPATAVPELIGSDYGRRMTPGTRAGVPISQQLHRFIAANSDPTPSDAPTPSALVSCTAGEVVVTTAGADAADVPLVPATSSRKMVPCSIQAAAMASSIRNRSPANAPPLVHASVRAAGRAVPSPPWRSGRIGSWIEAKHFGVLVPLVSSGGPTPDRPAPPSTSAARTISSRTPSTEFCSNLSSARCSGTDLPQAKFLQQCRSRIADC